MSNVEAEKNSVTEEEPSISGTSDHNTYLSEGVIPKLPPQNIEDFNEDMNENTAGREGNGCLSEKGFERDDGNPDDQEPNNVHTASENPEDETVEQLFSCTQINTPDGLRKSKTPSEN